MKLSNDAKTNRPETLKAVLHYFYHDSTQSGAHCKYNIKYHIVWIPKYRRKLLTEQMAKRLKIILAEIAKEYQFKIIASEVMSDHVHLLMEAPPKYSPSDIVRILKTNSSKRLRQEFLNHIKKYIWGKNVLWSRGYYIATVADGATTSIVKEYINNQRLHDNDIATCDNLKQEPLFKFTQ